MKSFYTTKEFGELIGLKSRSIAKYIEKGQIAAEKAGRDWLIAHEELERFKSSPRKVGRPAAKEMDND